MRYALFGIYSLSPRKRPARYRFSAIIGHLAIGKIWAPFKTLLVTDVRVREKRGSSLVAEHLWLPMFGSFVLPENLPRDARIEFSGVVSRYKRKNGETDYGIDQIEDVSIVPPALA